MQRERSWEEWRHAYATVNGVRLHYVHEGAGPLIVLLHGFPEFWYAWRHQISALAAAGYRVVTPDMRGYNTSGKPRGVSAYRVRNLVADVEALVRHEEYKSAIVVGHDWGGVVAWATAMQRPRLVDRLVILNSPHPAAFLREAKQSDQILRSSYMAAFQLPWLPENAIRAADYRVLRELLRTEPRRPNAFTERDVRRYVQAIAQPGALSGALNYYRALIRQSPSAARKGIRRIHAPTLLLWGEHDRYLNSRLTEGLETWVPNLTVHRFPEASHWLAADEPDAVNDAIVSFLNSASSEA